jgi:hypothetical protein
MTSTYQTVRDTHSEKRNGRVPDLQYGTLDDA